MVILLMAINGYYISGYWCILVDILLMVIDGYFIMSIGGY
jgi:hypothetical protein